MECCPTCGRPMPPEQKSLPGCGKQTMPSRDALWLAGQFGSQVGLAPSQMKRVRIRWAKAIDQMLAEGWEGDKLLRLLRTGLDYKFVIGNPWQLRDKAHRIKQMQQNQKADWSGELLA